MARFIEGQGWLAEEETKAPAGAAVVVGKAKAGNAGQGAASIATEDMAAALQARGMVIMHVDEVEALLVEKEDHAKLKVAHAELEQKLASIDELADTGAGTGTKSTTKPAKRSMDEMEALIAEATTLDQLTELMRDEERKTVLKLGDARAKEIQGDNA